MAELACPLLLRQSALQSCASFTVVICQSLVVALFYRRWITVTRHRCWPPGLPVSSPSLTQQLGRPLVFVTQSISHMFLPAFTGYKLPSTSSSKWQSSFTRLFMGLHLHWLSIRWRVAFMLACLVHQSLAGQTSTYVTSDIQLTADTGHPQLQSASERMCVIPRTHNSFSDRSFSAAGPRVWNALPSYLQQDMNYRHIKRALKGHMFWS